ncbi:MULTISPECIES: TerD family protein [unclassified Streptomyces]|uniref:TerD family protein n=1 Tax=unclassified Streptomyces TaxID=2593676 RepID=UPI000DAD6079|nr:MULTISPECIES: TerD family protein [unclassified Streptomyces]PZT77106.1 TerD-family protein [Streptomyces sp. AC1-42W]PZT78942.1 TerD-family protein [Streptomyces sp. AC1-42T]
MSTPNKDFEKVEVRVKWDPSDRGEAPNDLDIIAATYSADEPYGSPVYLVHHDSRAPDGTIMLERDSRTGQGFGYDEVMTLELNRISESYARVVVGVAIQQRDGRKTFGAIQNTGMQVREGYTTLSEDDFSSVGGATAAVVAEFVRDASGVWRFRDVVLGFDGDPDAFAAAMGGREFGA